MVKEQIKFFIHIDLWKSQEVIYRSRGTRVKMQSFSCVTFSSRNQTIHAELQLNDVCVNWSPPKTDLVTNFLNLENRMLENVSFSQ